jgi:TPR repeat protein
MSNPYLQLQYSEPTRRGETRLLNTIWAAYYFCGQGVAKDYVEAVKWWRKAAEQNYALAQYNLGLCYENGQGVAKDEVEAVKWFRKAAEQGDAKAQYNLGVCYRTGEGVAKDPIGAAKWFRKAAEQGDAEAQCDLGLCSTRGEGVARDEVSAYKWLSLASAQGNENAKGAKSALAQQMTPEQIAKGSRLARDFKPSRALESDASAPSR